MSAVIKQPNTADAENPYAGIRVQRRNGEITYFDIHKIERAITAAFLDVEGDEAQGSSRVYRLARQLAAAAANGATRSLSPGAAVHIEDIQDHVELALMREGQHKVARSYVIYREERARERAEKDQQVESKAVEAVEDDNAVHVVLGSGERVPARTIYPDAIREACEGLDDVSGDDVLEHVEKNIYDGISESELDHALLLCAKQLIESEPNYTYVAARLLLAQLRREAMTFTATHTGAVDQATMRELYGDYFRDFIEKGIEVERLDPELHSFDLYRLGQALKVERDLNFTYLGMQTLYDRYFLHEGGTRYELPQAFFMRVAMGLAINEDKGERDDRAIEFYEVLSSFDFMSSTPTLFNSATVRPQLSSCYLTSVADDLDGIYGSIRDNAMLSKFAGGLGNDWSNVRALGAYIKGTNGKSQGVVPFLKVANDTAVAVNQGGRRKGAVCAYLESWHLDIEEFLDLRKNTGDERRRTHDMNTANWIPDLFVKRVIEEGEWTLFSPSDVPDLHDLYGKAFEKAYVEYEAKADRGEIVNFKRVSAVTLWRKMLTMLFETGHPWFTFKDPCNIRSPQQHVGVVHSSNLCTEITLNTRPGDEIAVCNLGSINLPRHLTEDGNGNVVIDRDKLAYTVRVAMRMLDNVIDYNYYSVDTARQANARHRPVGLGMMGFQDALYKKGVAYESDDAVRFADESMELISYYAIQSSSELAVERGSYSSFEGSLWSQGILPIDSVAKLKAERGDYCEMDESFSLDWEALRSQVKRYGMRNSNCMAIAPTATIANITGVSQSIEPTYQNLYVKSNLSGEFTVINPYLAAELKRRGLWDRVMVSDLKYYDGSVQPIDRIPDDLKAVFKNAFEMDPLWLVEAASRRQKWIDQSQSLNLYMAEASGPKLDRLYKAAWRKGLKTTYYLRSLAATSAEKSTVEDARLNKVQGPSASPAPEAASTPAPVPSACSIDDPSCEACQ